jgi:hypothetical protein
MLTTKTLAVQICQLANIPKIHYLLYYINLYVNYSTYYISKAPPVISSRNESPNESPFIAACFLFFPSAAINAGGGFPRGDSRRRYQSAFTE